MHNVLSYSKFIDTNALNLLARLLARVFKSGFWTTIGVL